MLSDDGKAILTEHGDESSGFLAKDGVTKDEDEDEAGFKGDGDGAKARSLAVRFIMDERIELAIAVCLCFLSLPSFKESKCGEIGGVLFLSFNSI